MLNKPNDLKGYFACSNIVASCQSLLVKKIVKWLTRLLDYAYAWDSLVRIIRLIFISTQGLHI